MPRALAVALAVATQAVDETAFFRREIEVLEESIGLGAGWTAEQLERKHRLDHEIADRLRERDRKQASRAS